MLALDDTIVAVATAAGAGARSIVRLSGFGALAVVQSRFTADSGRSLAELCHAEVLSGSFEVCSLGALPVELYVWPTSQSYTRQPAVELHTLGSPPLAAAVVRELCAAGARAATPGEFTLRSFLAGRLDLTQAEAVLGVIDAHGGQQFDAALAQLAGGMSRPLHRLRESLIELLAHLEAGLDFVEEDIEFISADAIEATLAGAVHEVATLAEQLQSRGGGVTLPRAVLVGLPNAGKSSLFNAMVGHAAAIVSSVPGTTRDYLSAQVSIGGCDFELVDTAGIEAGGQGSAVEHSAQQATHSQRSSADLVLCCSDATRPLTEIEHAWLADSADRAWQWVLTKCDQPQAAEVAAAIVSQRVIATSATSRQGISDLLDAVRQAIAKGHDDGVIGTAERCDESVRLTAESLARARELNGLGGGEELIAAELRVALNELGKVVGVVYTDDILDRIFSRFCIGK